ncbi:hypothetical protein KC614_01895 [candidate division WWE3 bacterium]|uniref:Hydrolase n=1 Tax=candidate division WWE3 bacterium TaxID=2053526 RepID=A0A955LK14_UNCKA|nr:hypothetical protein [candidate division WWE3 bacterium]
MNTNPNAKRVLCFGDSLTWGYMPATSHERFAANVRWTGKLQMLLGDNYEIIEEGLNSRSLVSEDTRPGKEGRNGSTYIIPCLDTHDPIDLVIIMLGTNELKDNFESTPDQIISSFEEHFVKVIAERKSQFKDTNPHILIMIPPAIDLSKEYALARYANSKDKYDAMVSGYTKISQKYNASLILASEYVTTGDDGVHIAEGSHAKLADALKPRVENILND